MWRWLDEAKRSNEVEKEGGGSRRSGECVKQGRVRQRESEERWRTLFGVAFVEEERNRATKVEAEAERWRRRQRGG